MAAYLHIEHIYFFLVLFVINTVLISNTVCVLSYFQVVGGVPVSAK